MLKSQAGSPRSRPQSTGGSGGWGEGRASAAVWESRREARTRHERCVASGLDSRGSWEVSVTPHNALYMGPQHRLVE